MDEMVKQALSFYDLGEHSITLINDDRDAFKVMDGNGNRYFLKLYGMKNDYEIASVGRFYHTFDQIAIESEILRLLSEGDVTSATPVCSIRGEYVSILDPDDDGEPVYAMLSSFIDAPPLLDLQPHMTETAYLAGVAAAKLHLESEKMLLQVAKKRPHKRQDYVRAVRARLARGMETEAFTAARYEMLCECCEVVIDCMNRLDADAANVGLVHTDIRQENCFLAPEKIILADYSRSVYSYYLYDLAEMCLHGDFGGKSPELQRAILRGYHSVKPLKKEHPYMMQVFFALFMLTVMAQTVDSAPNAWRDLVLQWFEAEVHPGLVSGAGYMKPGAFDGICFS